MVAFVGVRGLELHEVGLARVVEVKGVHAEGGAEHLVVLHEFRLPGVTKGHLGLVGGAMAEQLQGGLAGDSVVLDCVVFLFGLLCAHLGQKRLP